MKLIYRGQSYSIANQSGPNTADATQQAKTKLIYRGQTYYTTPRSAEVEAVPATGSVVTLIYRGITYKRLLRGLKPYSPSRAINWRYQTNR